MVNGFFQYIMFMEGKMHIRYTLINMDWLKKYPFLGLFSHPYRTTLSFNEPVFYIHHTSFGYI